MSNIIFFELSVNKEIDKLVLLYNNNSIFQTDSNKLKFKETLGRNEYIMYSNFSDFINNLDLDIYLNNKVERVKLEVKMDYLNDDLFLKNQKEIAK